MIGCLQVIFLLLRRRQSQIEHVQFANPPLRMSANTARLHFEMTRPSMRVSESCNFPEKFVEQLRPTATMRKCPHTRYSQ